MAKEVPIWEKANLTLEEAAAYSGIGTASCVRSPTIRIAILSSGWATSD